MRQPAQGILAMLLSLSVATDGNGQDEPSTPTEQFAALLKEYKRVPSAGPLASDEERMQYVGQVYQHYNRVAVELVDLAEQYPHDPLALDALIQAGWQVNTIPWPVEVAGEDTARRRAYALLQRDHVQSDKLGPLCHRVSFGYCQEYESFLRAVLEKNPHPEVQGLACLGLAHFLNGRLQRLDLVKEQPERAKEFENLFGKEYLQELLRQDRSEAIGEMEALFERAAEQYAEVTVPYGGTVGQKATAELFEIRHLGIGKVAPDIEGEDQDGQRFKLSDYRGKVVLLDFWHQQ